ncbi:MAG: nucleotide exchange factor GrpE [Patescibacteria group bacterium]
MADKKKKKINTAQILKQLEESQKLKDEYLACWQRERADLLNYKKDEIIRIGEIVGYANTDLILKVLPILDNFYLAEKQLPSELKNNKHVEGLLQIKAQLESFLKTNEVEAIEAINEKFDPNFHEVVGEIKDKTDEGTVLEEIQKGYQFHGRVIRPAKVKVSKFKI